jgi:hypothetical protein
MQATIERRGRYLLQWASSEFLLASSRINDGVLPSQTDFSSSRHRQNAADDAVYPVRGGKRAHPRPNAEQTSGARNHPKPRFPIDLIFSPEQLSPFHIHNHVPMQE